MITKMQLSRGQMWFARGAMAAIAVLLIILLVFGPGSIRAVKDGSTTTYSGSLLLPIIFAIMGVMACLAGVMYLRQPGFFFRAVGVVLFLIGIYCLFNSPTGLNHRVIVTSEYFFHRIGSWYSPAEAKVEFDSVVYMTIEETGADDQGHKRYELQCFEKQGGEKIRIPIHDLMRKALPEILKKAVHHDVVIGENAEGWQIPPDLRE